MKTLVSLRSLGVLAALALVPTLAPRPAQACGGLFCDGGPMSMPVDQSGENILFVWKDDAIEVHIQIQYVGDAEKFGWVIPLQSVPEFSVGSEPLFQALLAGSVPTYGYTQTQDDCGQQGSGISTAAGGDFNDDGGGDDEDSGAGGDPPGPEIVEVVRAGAFEITVIQGDDAQEVATWLDENGYLQDPEALPILQEYIAEGHLFGAVKLVGGAGVDAIHPIVLEFQGNEPCVPLRLTRIAAVENMGVRSFFLGGARMVPRNYRHVLVNPLKIDWLAFGANYDEVITLAVDEENADGRAFVTEYAGSSSVVPGIFADDRWNADAFATVEPTGIGGVMQTQGLLGYDFNGEVAFTHPLMESLLASYITPPPGISLPEYLTDQTVAGADLSLWNGPEFAAQMQEFIVDPAHHAEELLQLNPYLTRMFTTISPAEMTEDPMFYENPMLPEVTNVQQGTLRTLCNGEQVFIFPDGRELYLPTPDWPELPDEPGGVDGAMPSAQRIEAVPDNGAPMVLADNTEAIDTVLRAWNEDHRWNGNGGPLSVGCDCSATPDGTALVSLFGLGGLLLLRRRRR